MKWIQGLAKSVFNSNWTDLELETITWAIRYIPTKLGEQYASRVR